MRYAGIASSAARDLSPEAFPEMTDGLSREGERTAFRHQEIERAGLDEADTEGGVGTFLPGLVVAWWVAREILGDQGTRTLDQSRAHTLRQQRPAFPADVAGALGEPVQGRARHAPRGWFQSADR